MPTEDSSESEIVIDEARFSVDSPWWAGMLRRGSERLSEAVSMCSACALGARGKGVPGMWVTPYNRPRHNGDTSDRKPGRRSESGLPTAPSCPVCCHPAGHSYDAPTLPLEEDETIALPSQGGAQADRSGLPLSTPVRSPPLSDTGALGADALAYEQPASPDRNEADRSHSIGREGYQQGDSDRSHRSWCSSCYNCNTNRSDSQSVMVLGEAPGAVEQERGKPFVGQSGELLHSMLKEAGLESYYVSNIAKHQPFKDSHGKQQAPSKTEIEACAPFLRAEFDLIRPVKLILLGKTAAKLVVEGNFSMGKVVNQTYEVDPFGTESHRGIPSLVLYHPAYFLRQRTAPWIQKQISDWKRAVRMFLGDRPPTYQIEKVKCDVHSV